MTTLHQYIIRAASREALLDKLVSAENGKARPFVVTDETGARNVDPARIRYPWPEMTEGVFDAETGDAIQAPEPTGDWLCEVWLSEPNAALAAIAEAD